MDKKSDFQSLECPRLSKYILALLSKWNCMNRWVDFLGQMHGKHPDVSVNMSSNYANQIQQGIHNLYCTHIMYIP